MELSSPSLFYSKHPFFGPLCAELHATEKKITHVSGLKGSSHTLLAASILQKAQAPIFFLLPDRERAAYFLNDLENLLPEKSILFFPSSYKEDKPELDASLEQERTETLNRLRTHPSQVAVVTFPQALAEPVFSRKKLEENVLDLKIGEETSLEDLTTFLLKFKFEKTDFVFEPGQFSVRGGILDIFSFANQYPYRISLAGTVIETIRLFDPGTQLSRQNLSSVSLIPNLKDEQPGKDLFTSFLPKESGCWLVDGKLSIDILEKPAEYEGVPIPGNLVSSAEVKNALANFTILESGSNFLFDAHQTFPFNTRPQPSFNKNFELLFSTLSEQKQEKYFNFIFADTPKQVERIYSIFEDLNARKKYIAQGKAGDLFTIHHQPLHEGFLDQDLNIACFTDHQIFDRYHRFRLRQRFSSGQALTLKDLNELRPGDFVTHVDHGIGKYGGLEKLEVNGNIQEAIRLIYRDNDILYISIHALHRISRYAGKEGEAPSVHKLGSNAWSTLKQKTKKKVKDIARDLILLYAKRKAQPGYPFPPDNYLQNELEASFIYEDTPDQIKATKDVKKDMEASSPMDRLICGDVGFGKTEIAIRAAFKAATDGKQTAILVPTTILAFQHFKTFSDRLKNFPVDVDFINRFKSGKEKKQTLEKVKSGKVDILIGTHKILGKEIGFNNLGLLIIDEEQKFGVSAKEKLKALKINVDTLTLTATPIPRTLQFSMMGARDLSLINTPPPNRFPVSTKLRTFNHDVIRNAIRQELERGGQVFFVHNRVQNIHEVADLVKRLVPDATVATGHGQMEGDQLEETMLGFVEGDTDILVSTTIIESGLDIPNANTIIINDAQNFGLSDLHQMRGRVGRSNKQAFCYLLSPPQDLLTPQARQRLRAVEEFSDLGSGIQISMRDLDIRGAGNLLGAEQSGFISEIGFDMFHKILDEAIRELKETDFKELFHDEEPKETAGDCTLESDLALMIPDYFVENITERLNLYRELDEISEEEDLQTFKKNLEDRFGPIPGETLDLMDAVRLRWLAGKLGIEKLVLKNKRMVGWFISNPEAPFFKGPRFQKVMAFITRKPSLRLAETKEKLSLTFPHVIGVKPALETLKEIWAFAEVNQQEKQA